MDIEAWTPMFRKYSRWIGDTLRNTEKLRSSGAAPASAATSREAAYSRSGMNRSQFLVYSSRAWRGMSDAG